MLLAHSLGAAQPAPHQTEHTGFCQDGVIWENQSYSCRYPRERCLGYGNGGGRAWRRKQSSTQLAAVAESAPQSTQSIRFPYGNIFSITSSQLAYQFKCKEDPSLGLVTDAGSVIDVLQGYISDERIHTLRRAASLRTYDLMVMIEGISNYGNISAITRTCEGFGIGALHYVDASDEMVTIDPAEVRFQDDLEYLRPPHTLRVTQRLCSYMWQITANMPKYVSHENNLHKLASGSSKWMHLREWNCPTRAIRWAQKAGYQVVASTLNPRAVPLQEVDMSKPTCILLGNEANGLTQEAQDAADQCVYFPMRGLTESFNVAAAGAIFLQYADMQQKGYRGTRLTDEQQEILLARYMAMVAPKSLRKHVHHHSPAPQFRQLYDSQSVEMDPHVFSPSSMAWLDKVMTAVRQKKLSRKQLEIVRYELLGRTVSLEQVSQRAQDYMKACSAYAD